ncbi:hypothetical protein [Neisseria iguanae]|uniref:Uncharacterized protein n=1 Tax=Neisseria iguanae TaxID=90242 RepID=A0A2P7U2I1_9NEIS|nr:hypothetical protein [Neisseria iguanae]PSJ81189.1 hypothetical protein C7N83_01840 [Neisseria iguanae]
MFFYKQPLQPVPQSIIGTYPTVQAAERQVELFLLNRDADICLNIVQSEKGYTVQSVKWQ